MRPFVNRCLPLDTSRGDSSYSGKVVNVRQGSCAGEDGVETCLEQGSSIGCTSHLMHLQHLPQGGIARDLPADHDWGPLRHLELNCGRFFRLHITSRTPPRFPHQCQSCRVAVRHMANLQVLQVAYPLNSLEFECLIESASVARAQAYIQLAGVECG